MQKDAVCCKDSCFVFYNNACRVSTYRRICLSSLEPTLNISIQEYEYSEYEDDLEEIESIKPTLFRSMEGRLFRGQTCEYIKLKDVSTVTGCENGKQKQMFHFRFPNRLLS